MLMKDDELREFINVTPEEFEKLRAYIEEKRPVYEAMNILIGDVELWQAGLGPKPTNVIPCGPRQVRGAR